MDFLADDFKQNEGIDLRKDRQALQRLTEAAEKAKMELSSVAQTSISLPFITATADGPKHIEAQLSRAKFESICSDLLDRCRIPVEQALKDAKLKLSDLNEVSKGEKKGKNYTFRHEFNEKPGNIPGCPNLNQVTLCKAEVCGRCCCCCLAVCTSLACRLMHT